MSDPLPRLPLNLWRLRLICVIEMVGLGVVVLSMLTGLALGAASAGFLSLLVPAGQRHRFADQTVELAAFALTTAALAGTLLALGIVGLRRLLRGRGGRGHLVIFHVALACGALVKVAGSRPSDAASALLAAVLLLLPATALALLAGAPTIGAGRPGERDGR